MSNGKRELTPLWFRRQLQGTKQQKSSSKASLKVVMLFLTGSFVGINILLVWCIGSDKNAGSTYRHAFMLANDGHEYPPTMSPQSTSRRRLTMPPRDSSFDSAGYVHIGKTGGSTISKLLRNGCNSFETGPCRTVPHETQLSKLVVRKKPSGVEISMLFSADDMSCWPGTAMSHFCVNFSLGALLPCSRLLEITFIKSWHIHRIRERCL
jgi:hypothetical protein